MQRLLNVLTYSMIMKLFTVLKLLHMEIVYNNTFYGQT